MLNPQFIGYDTENGVTLTTNFRKKEEETVIWTWEKGKQKTKKFSGTTTLSTIRANSAVQVEDMYLPGRGNWINYRAVSKKYCAIPR